MAALREFQREFGAALLADAGELGDGAFEAAAVPVATATAIYRNNVNGKLTEALGDLYPVVRRLVGDAFFAHATRQFARRHPPRSPVLAEYGAGLPAFLDRFAPAAQVPYLGDVARLELARHQALTAPDALPLEPRAMKTIPPQRLGDVRLRLHPSCRLLRSPYPVEAIRAAHETVGDPGPVTFPDHETCLLVARPWVELVTSALDTRAFALVAALEAGRTLAEAFAESGGGWDPQTALTGLIAGGAFISFRIKEETP